jgi:hypothetical protein
MHGICCTYQSFIKSKKYQVSHRYGVFSWWWAHSCPKHVENSNECTHYENMFTTMFLFTRLYLYKGTVHSLTRLWHKVHLFSFPFRPDTRTRLWHKVHLFSFPFRPDTRRQFCGIKLVKQSRQVFPRTWQRCAIDQSNTSNGSNWAVRIVLAKCFPQSVLSHNRN